jgi:8-oxo-dGTP pyrophosphatase MutT (NUDIX family)
VKPVEPQPAASIVLVRPGSAEPIEVYMIRRKQGMRFLGGFYAFPGGKVDEGDRAGENLGLCRGLTPEEAEHLLLTEDGIPPLAFWVAAVRELLEETGILMACDGAGRPLDCSDPTAAARVERCRKALMANERSLTALLVGEGWFYHLSPLRSLSHFITPAPSPIRFSARFFLASVPAGQEPRLYTEEASEGFWIGPREGYRRFHSGELTMAEPAEYALGYLSQFESYEALWENHADGRQKFHGIVDRIDFYGEAYDWNTASWRGDKPSWRP